MRKVDDLLGAFAQAIDQGAPVPRISRDEAAAITDVLHADMDRGVDAREAEAVKLGHTVACARGCNSCCAQVVVTAEAEAVTVARWLEQHAPERARFLAAHARWRGDPIVARVSAAAAAGDRATKLQLSAESMRSGLMCPFNHEGACDIYPVRPNLCRKVHALDSAEPCKSEGEGTVLEFVPIDQFLANIRPLERAMHASLGAGPELPLAERVAALLRTSTTSVGRNDPCPCGSGKKYKKCHGA